MTKKKTTKQKSVTITLEKLEMYKEAIGVLKEIEKLPMVSFHLERFKYKYRQEFK